MHVMEGLANHIYFNSIVKTSNKEKMEDNSNQKHESMKCKYKQY